MFHPNVLKAQLNVAVAEKLRMGDNAAQTDKSYNAEWSLIKSP